jgi:hypothetical protein
MKTETTFEYADRMKPLLEKYRKGEERIEDDELKDLIKHFSKLEKLLYASGERFHFAWVDTNNQLQRVQGFQNHRDNK